MKLKITYNEVTDKAIIETNLKGLDLIWDAMRAASVLGKKFKKATKKLVSALEKANIYW